MLTLLMSSFVITCFRTISCRCWYAAAFARCFADFFMNFLTTLWVTLATFLLLAIVTPQGQGVAGGIGNAMRHGQLMVTPELARCRRILLSTRPCALSTGVRGGTCPHPAQGAGGRAVERARRSGSSSCNSCCCAPGESTGFARSATRDGCEPGCECQPARQVCWGGMPPRVTRRRVGQGETSCPMTWNPKHVNCL